MLSDPLRLLQFQMEKLQSPHADHITHQETRLMEHALPLNEDNELLNYQEITCVNALDRIRDAQTETSCFDAENRFLVPETHASMRSAHTCVYSLRSQLQCEEHEETPPGFGPNTVSEDPASAINRDLSIKPSFTDINPFHTPRLNPAWPALVPHCNPVASVPHQNQFWPMYTPPQHFNPAFNPVCNFKPGFNPAFNFNPGFNFNSGFNPAFNFNPGFNFNPVFNPAFNFNPGFNLASNFNPGFNPKFNFNPGFNPLVACGESAFSCLVLGPHMSVYPVSPPPYPHLNTTGSVSYTHSHTHSHTHSFPADVLDSYGLWQRLCETAKDFSSGSPDTEALACFFIRAIRSLAVHSPDLPFSEAVRAAVEEWRRIPPFQRQQYHVAAKMFIELEEQNKSTNRADEDQSIPKGNVKKARKRSKKARPVEDLAESALAEYSPIMDALGSKVSDGSGVTAADEEDVCAQYFNQLLNHCEFTNEAGFDMDYITSLLSEDHNLTDVLKENSQDLFSSAIPKPVAGCSHWTPQRDLSQYNDSNLQDHMTQKSFRISTPTGMENGGQNASQTLSSQGVQETINSAFQDFGASGNSSGVKSETLYDPAELETTVQSECFSLQNYKSHHASFAQSIKHSKTPANAGVEHDGEENLVARQKTEEMGSTMEKRNMDTDIPNDSQQGMINNTVTTQQNVKETSEEKNVNRNKKQKRRRRRRKPEKIMALDERTTDDKRPNTAENQRNRKTQDVQRRSATKHGAKETDLLKIITEKEQLRQRTDLRSRVESRRTTQAERSDGKEWQKWAIGENGDGFPIARDETKTHSNPERRRLRRSKVEECNEKPT